VAKKAKQEELPGMEERIIKDLHECAIEYAEARDRRQEIGREEVELKTRLLALMKKHQKEAYEFQGVRITIVHEEETVKVKITKPKEAEEE
jgi:cation transport regulator ChaB